jgi:hypothetical protein
MVMAVEREVQADQTIADSCVAARNDGGEGMGREERGVEVEVVGEDNLEVVWMLLR